MREMVLNHASVLVPGSNRCEVSAWLRELAEGMRRLVEAEVVLKSLRTAHALYDTQCLHGYSLFDAYLTLQSGGFREEFRLSMGLTDKQPLLMEVGPDVEVDPFQWTVYVLGFMQLLDSASRSPWVSNSPVLGDDGAGYTILR